MISLAIFDQNLTNIINSVIPHTNFFDYIFRFFSQQGYSVMIWIVIIFLLFLFEEKRNHKFILYFIVIFSTSILVSTIIKDVIKRPRPCIGTIASCPKDYSFPSGHSMTAFAAAGVISYFDKKRRLLYYSIAALIGLSRIYLGYHYFFDVVAGGITGYFISFGLTRLSINK